MTATTTAIDIAIIISIDAIIDSFINRNSFWN